MLLAPAVALLLLLGSSLAESLALHAAAPAVDLTTVFTSGEKDERGFAINSFRIPGFTVANTHIFSSHRPNCVQCKWGST